MGEATIDGAGLRAFVTNALDLKLKGRSEHYNMIITQLSKRDDLEALHRLFVALSACVTTLTGHPEKFDALFQALYKYEWPVDERVSSALSGLVTLLVSVNGTFLHPTLKMLARGLSLKPQAFPAGEATGGDPRFESLHKALRHSLALVPTGQSELFPYLRDVFPHRRNDPALLVNFARQLLLTTQYVPALRNRVLGLIIERCLEIDVEIKIEDSGEARYQVDEEALVLSEHALTAQDFYDPLNDNTTQPAPQKTDEPTLAVDEMADKLDGLMLLLFEYLDNQNRVGGSSVSSLLEGLLPVLESSILPTHRCKYVQFVLYFLCTNSNTASQALLQHLCGIIRSEAQAPVLRQSAASYVASFLARSKALSGSSIVQVLLELSRDLQHYVTDDMARQHDEARWRREQQHLQQHQRERDEQEDEPPLPALNPLHRHLVFYSLCQAVLYVVAFHHSTVGGEDLLGLNPSQPHSPTPHDHAHTQMQEELRWRLASLVQSHLRPLERCLDSVRREFLRLASRHALLDPQVLVELGGPTCHHHARRIVNNDNNGPTNPTNPDEEARPCWCAKAPPAAAGSPSHCHPPPSQQPSNPLDSYFPFDPYILRRSSRYVATPDVYRYWQATAEFTEDHEDGNEGLSDASLESLAGDSSDSDVSDSEDEEEEEEETEDQVTAMSLDSRAGGFLKAAAAGRGRVKSRRQRVESLDLTNEEEGESGALVVEGRDGVGGGDSSDSEDEEQWTLQQEEEWEEEGQGGEEGDDEEIVSTTRRARALSVESIGSW